MNIGIRRNCEIHIDDITNRQRGLRCKCKCPHCKGRLEALLPDSDPNFQRRFRHHREDKDCAEYRLHKLAQDIIAESRRILLPDNTEIQYTNPVLEKPLANRKFFADIYADFEYGHLVVEVTVTHKCPMGKIVYYCKQDWLVMEIVLNKADFSLDELSAQSILKEAVLNDLRIRKWIKHPQIDTQQEIDFSNKPKQPIKIKKRQNSTGIWGWVILVLGGLFIFLRYFWVKRGRRR